MNKLLFSASVQLVGLANDEPLLQMYLGNFMLKKEHMGYVPSVRLISVGQNECWPIEYRFHEDDSASVVVPGWGGGTGLSIRSYPLNEKFHFSTGLNGYDSGSSGKLVNGGPEMFNILKELNSRL